MLGFIANRLIRSLIVLFLISVVTFTFMQLVPGGPFSANAGGRPRPPEVQARLEAQYGLDRPPVEQYLVYMRKLLFEFDFGPSLRQIDFTVNQLLFGVDFKSDPLGSPVLVSAQVGLYSFLLAVIVGIPMGIVSALYRNKAPDHAAMFITTLGISVPNFVLGLLMILLFSLTLNWLPVFGWGDSWKQAVMPIITLGTGGMAILARLTRASVLETLGQDYIRTARAKGLRERIVLAKHALPNSLIPVVTVLGPMLAAWLTGTFFVELVFAIPGIGKFFITAVTDRDYSLIMATILIYSSVLVIANLVVDVAYGFLDPRIRYD
ncbi:MAG: ABC transporter permease [Anaerolineales bacterium]|jgi:ABC-type dipeptide/oligopeptide/nickel transport system permease component